MIREPSHSGPTVSIEQLQEQHAEHIVWELSQSCSANSSFYLSLSLLLFLKFTEPLFAGLLSEVEAAPATTGTYEAVEMMSFSAISA